MKDAKQAVQATGELRHLFGRYVDVGGKHYFVDAHGVCKDMAPEHAEVLLSQSVWREFDLHDFLGDKPRVIADPRPQAAATPSQTASQLPVAAAAAPSSATAPTAPIPMPSRPSTPDASAATTPQSGKAGRRANKKARCA